MTQNRVTKYKTTYYKLNNIKTKNDPLRLLAVGDLSRVIEMAWEDRTPFDAIKRSFFLSETDVIRIMRIYLKRTSFEMWRKRVAGRKTKHRALCSDKVSRAYCPTQHKQKSKRPHSS